MSRPFGLPWRPLTAALLLVAAFSRVPFAVASEPQAAPESGGSSEDRLRSLEKQLADLRAELAALKAAAAGTETEKRLAEIERRIDVLTQEIEKMKLGEAAAVPPANAASGGYGVGPAASKVYGKDGLSVGGYGEALYQNFAETNQSGGPADADDQITLLRAVLYVGYKFDRHFVLNSEIEYENAVVASDKGGEAEVEFAYIDYMHSRSLNARAGLVLIPMGLVNELHEPTTFLGARRPDVEEFILPTTWRELGAGIYGNAGPLTYRGYFVNGLNAAGYDAAEGIREGRQEGSEALAHSWAFTSRLDYTGTPGLLVGASVFTGDSGQGHVTPSGVEVEAPTTVVDVHADWRWRGIWLRGLYAHTTIGEAALVNELNGLVGDESVGSRQQGWYLQAAFDFLSLGSPSRASLFAFARFEEYDTQAAVPAGFERNPANHVHELTVGAAYKPIDRIVIKADWQQRHDGARTGVDQWNVALGYVF